VEIASSNDPQSHDPDGEVIEGGHIGEIDEIPFQHDRHHVETASRLAYVLVGMMAVSVLLHYLLTAVAIYSCQPLITKELGDIFDKWLPVISGLVGGAVTYYFTRIQK
jgi:hypothetical protein